MEREREIRAFVPEKYWKILGLFETQKKPASTRGDSSTRGGEKLTLICSEEIKDLPGEGEKLVEKILEEGKKEIGL